VWETTFDRFGGKHHESGGERRDEVNTGTEVGNRSVSTEPDRLVIVRNAFHAGQNDHDN
jgi:hypothetical protein